MKQKKHFIIALLAMAVVASWATIVFFHLHQPEELRQKAAVPNGTETIVLSPKNTSYVVGNPIAISLAANLTNIPIDGFQVVADMTGTVPNNLSFQAVSIPGVTCVRNLFTATNMGKRLELACITKNPQTPFTALVLLTFGIITGKVLSQGAMTISWNTTLTKITKNKTAEDIVNIPQQATYTFVNPTPTPPKKPTPKPSPKPTPKPTPKPCFFRLPWPPHVCAF